MSNKQPTVLSTSSPLVQHGCAAVVVSDNVLFKGGVGGTIRRELLKQADVVGDLEAALARSAEITADLKR